MAWKISVDADVNCVFIKHYGAFELADVLGTAEDIFGHPDYRAGMSILRDRSEQGITADIHYKSLAGKINDTMGMLGPRIGRCKTAIVVGDAQNYAKVHQFTVAGRLGEYPSQRKPFRDIENALRWLGLPEGYEITYPAAETA
jgi:hypothetical protein